MPPTITALYAGLLAVFIVLLAARVAKFRHANRIGIGEGDNRALARMIRVHGNAVENAPLGLLLLLLCELVGTTPTLLHLAGAALVVGRIAHAFGLSRTSGASVGRVAGMALSWAAMVLMAGVLVGAFFGLHY
jgi:uncharacterized protein